MENPGEPKTTEEYLNPDTQAVNGTPTSSDVGKQTLNKDDIREGQTPGEFLTNDALDESLRQGGISVSPPDEGADTHHVDLTIDGIVKQVKSEPKDDEAPAPTHHDSAGDKRTKPSEHKPADNS